VYCSPSSVEWKVNDGEKLEQVTVCAIVRGPMRKILLGERVALNILARCSGIATKYALSQPFLLDLLPPHFVEKNTS
jgi:nicotinate-nucleotide pyrophosphorylase (carboxylating)